MRPTEAVTCRCYCRKLSAAAPLSYRKLRHTSAWRAASCLSLRYINPSERHAALKKTRCCLGVRFTSLQSCHRVSTPVFFHCVRETFSTRHMMTPGNNLPHKEARLYARIIIGFTEIYPGKLSCYRSHFSRPILWFCCRAELNAIICFPLNV